MRIKTSSTRTIKLLVRGKAGTASLFFPHSSFALNTEHFCLVSCLVSGPSTHVGVIKSSIKTPSFMHSGTAACLPHSLLAFHSPFHPIQWNINSISDKCSLSYNTFLTSFCSCSGCIKRSCNIFQWVIESFSNPDICSVQGYLNMRGTGIGFSKIYPTKLFRKKWAGNLLPCKSICIPWWRIPSLVMLDQPPFSALECPQPWKSMVQAFLTLFPFNFF